MLAPDKEIKSNEKDDKEIASIADQLENTIDLKEEDKGDEYLYLPTLDDKRLSYIISMPPMNSTGDIYHILAYLILVLFAGKTIPNILLTYDSNEIIENSESKMNTYTQVMRSLDFAKQLGKGKFFLAPKSLDTGTCQRENNRQSVLEKYFESLGPFVFYIDQKALTTLIAYYIYQNGIETTTKILRKGYMQRDPNFISPENNQKIVDSATDEIERIKKSSAGKPLIALHLRYSSKANESQNIDNTHLLHKLSDFLTEKSYAIWFIIADGRKQQSFNSIKKDSKTKVFPFNLDDKGTQVDYGKLYHTQLLHDLKNLKNLHGMIGNTSGTLDLAAFLGHNVYNIHQFNAKIDYQAYRILIQTAFLSLDFFNEAELENAMQDPDKKLGKITQEISDKHLPNLTPWLESKNASTKFTPKIPKSSVVSVDIKKSGYQGLFFIQNFKKAEQKLLPCANDITQLVVNKLS